MQRVISVVSLEGILGSENVRRVYVMNQSKAEVIAGGVERNRAYANTRLDSLRI